MKIFVLFLIFPLLTIGQSTIKGTVKEKKGETLPGANIQIAGTYDGASTDGEGNFIFNTDEIGEKILSVSLLGYKSLKKSITIKKRENVFDFVLEESINSLNAVVVTAGTFEASDEKKMVMLKPLDIVTTAGGNADITAVVQLLPGSNRVGEQEGLFVRGGSANETKTVIDGMIVQNPFFSSTPDVPQRGRFSPLCSKVLPSVQEDILLSMDRLFPLYYYYKHKIKLMRKLTLILMLISRVFREHIPIKAGFQALCITPICLHFYL